MHSRSRWMHRIASSTFQIRLEGASLMPGSLDHQKSHSSIESRLPFFWQVPRTYVFSLTALVPSRSAWRQDSSKFLCWNEWLGKSWGPVSTRIQFWLGQLVRVLVECVLSVKYYFVPVTMFTLATSCNITVQIADWTACEPCARRTNLSLHPWWFWLSACYLLLGKCNEIWPGVGGNQRVI